jgi:hypothetical protein
MSHLLQKLAPGDSAQPALPLRLFILYREIMGDYHTVGKNILRSFDEESEVGRNYGQPLQQDWGFPNSA